MTGPQPHPIELLARLDADALGPIAAARARRQLATDPRTAAARTAMAATRAELAGLAAAPAPDLPPDVAARCAAALAGLPPPNATAPAAAAPRRWPSRTAALLAAAAVLAGAVALGLGWLQRSDPPAVPDSPAQLALTRDTLASAVGDGLARRDLGPLNDPQQLAACQRAVGRPAQPPLGGREVLLDGRAGVLLVLPTGVVGRFRLVVVVPECGTTQTSPVLADVVAGR